jgi:ADP-heptose:LPS heptosyltransferase
MFQELILMSHLDVMLSMDSANMHLASLTGTPVVSVWGATHPMAGFLGFNQSEDNIIQLDLDCRPCSIYGNKSCRRGDYACLQNIPPERIVERISTLINN